MFTPQAFRSLPPSDRVPICYQFRLNVSQCQLPLSCLKITADWCLHPYSEHCVGVPIKWSCPCAQRALGLVLQPSMKVHRVHKAALLKSCHSCTPSMKSSFWQLISLKNNSNVFRQRSSRHKLVELHKDKLRDTGWQ